MVVSPLGTIIFNLTLTIGLVIKLDFA